MGTLHEKIYCLLTDATPDDLRTTNDVVEKAAPANFAHLLVARTCSKIGDRLASPKTTLAWILQALGAPAIFAGLIVPVREAGSLLPQLALSNYLKRFALRKWAWSLGAALQGLAIAGCAVAALTLEGVAAGWSILLLVVLFSLARGISSISAKDVLGKTIPKSKRGQLTGWAGSISGLITICAAGLLLLQPESSSIQNYALYLAAAAILWWLAAAVNLKINEQKSEPAKDQPLLSDLRDKLTLLSSDRGFRDFLIVRTLAIGSGLSAPYIITLAHSSLGGASMWLGIFIISEGLAATVAAPLWGKWADRSSRAVLRCSMLLVSALLTTVILHSLADAAWIPPEVFFPAIFFLLGMVHAGVRVGRKTYIVDMAEGDKRTDYVAVANTMIGLLLLIAGLITGLVSLLSLEATLSIFVLLALAGAIFGQRLEKVSKHG